MPGCRDCVARSLRVDHAGAFFLLRPSSTSRKSHKRQSHCYPSHRKSPVRPRDIWRFPWLPPRPLVCVIHAESLLDSPYSWKRVMTCHWYPRLPLPPECMKPGTDDLPPCRAWASKEEATIEASFQSAWQQGGRSSGVSLAKRAIRLVPGRARLPQVLRVARVTANPLSPGHRASSYFASWKMIPSA